MSKIARTVGKSGQEAGKPEALLLEISVACLTIASAVATYTGALHLVNGKPWTAAVFTVAIQGALLAVAHLAQRHQAQRSRALLVVAWVATASFSIFTSALGILDLQKKSIQNSHDRQDMQHTWAASADEVRGFYIGCRAWLSDALVSNVADLHAERERERSARRLHESYSRDDLYSLYRERRSLLAIEKELRNPPFIGSKAPDSVSDARADLDHTFAQADLIYSKMPKAFRTSQSAPVPPAEKAQPQSNQDLLIEEIHSGSVRGRVILGIAILLDALPAILLAALKRRRGLAAWIRDVRSAGRDLVSAVSENQTLHREHLRLSIEPGDLAGTVTFGSQARVLYPADLVNAFEQLEDSLARTMGSDVKIVSISNAAGAEIVPELPLIPQLDGDLIRLRVEARSELA
ncbi:MAG: hypothetical protein ACRD19_07470 [Terriglobia bacterium]